MKMSTFSIALLTVLVMTTAVVPANAAIEVEGDVYAGVSSMYLWRGFDLSSGDAVIQGGSDISAKGFTLSYWSNYDLDSSDVNETDITIDYSKSLSELVSVSVGNIYYMLEGADNTNELYLGVSLNTLLSPTLTIFYDYDAANETGLFYTLSIGHDFKINDQLSASLGALLSYNDESDYSVGTYSNLHNYELSASGSYALSDQIEINPFLIFSDAASNDAENLSVLPLESELAGGINLSISF